jgi:hypothetical protein
VEFHPLWNAEGKAGAAPKVLSAWWMNQSENAEEATEKAFLNLLFFTYESTGVFVCFCFLPF